MNGSDLPSESSTLEQALAAERSARLRLAAAHAATRVLATAISTDDAVHGVLADVCRTLGFQWASFWRPAGDALECKAIYQDPSLTSSRFTEMTRGFRFKRGVGLPGRVWDSREPLWIAEVRDDPNFPRAPIAAEVGLRGGFGFPVTVDGEVMGVMEFFSSRRLEPNLELLETMSGVGDQIGQFVSRRNAELAMRESDAKFRAFTESIADAAFAIDENSRIVYANPAVERIFGYAPHELIGQSLTMLVPERMREAHRRGVRRYLVTGHRNIPWEGVELPGLHRSGREVPVEISFGTYTIGDRRFFTGMVRDISDRVRQNEILQGTAAELETTVEELSARKDEAEEARFEA
ncbi:MAG: PAS domain S-box protein, partial [Longimicrobiales bacterium]